MLAWRTHFWTTATFAALALVQFFVALTDMRSSLANFAVHNSTMGPLRPLSLMYGFPRVSLTLVEPSILAMYLLSGWALWLYAVEQPPVASDRARRLFTASGVFMGVAIITTGSRMAYIVFAVLTVVALAVRPRRVQRMSLVAVSVLVGLFLTGPSHTRALVVTLLPKWTPAAVRPAPPRTTRSSLPGATAIGPAAWMNANVDEAVERVESAVATQDISVQQRMASYLVAVNVFRERPLFGTGVGTSNFYMERYWPGSLTPLPEHRVFAQVMLSHYATVITETGIAGMACLTMFALALIRRLVDFARLRRENHVVAWGLGAAIAGYSIAGFASALVTYQILLVWLLPAIALSLSGNGVGLRSRPHDPVTTRV